MLFGTEVLLELRVDVSYFFFINRLQKYCITNFIWKTKNEKYLSEYIFFCSFSYRGKVIIKSICNIIGIGYSITIFQGEYVSALDATV